jgi:membrane protease YdiL (CAAX protease family)
MTEKPPFPGFWQTIGILLIIAILQFFAANIFAAWGITKLTPMHLAGVNFITIAIGLAIGLMLSKKSFAETFPLRPATSNVLFAAVAAFSGAIILLSESDNLMRSVFPPPAWLVEIFEDLTGGQASPIGSILALVIVAPVMEEFLFRGLILNGFLQRYSTWTAIFVSAFLFGAFHFNPWQFIGAFTLGILFAWMYVKTRSLFLPILGHALNNALPLVISSTDLRIRGFSSELGGAIEFQPLWFDLLGVILLLGGLWLLRSRLQGEPTVENEIVTQ